MIILKAEDIQNADFLAGVTILVDKPLEWTSFDVVNKIRFLLRKKQWRIYLIARNYSNKRK